MELPILSELAQCGLVGVCISLIIALCFCIKLFVGALIKFAEEINNLNKVIAKLNADVQLIARRRKPKQEETPTNGE